MPCPSIQSNPRSRVSSITSVCCILSTMIAIVDYDMANLRSVQKAFGQVGVDAQIIRRPEEIDRADRLVVPGVGAFKDAIATLRDRHLDEAIVRHINRG